MSKSVLLTFKVSTTDVAESVLLTFLPQLIDNTRKDNLRNKNTTYMNTSGVFDVFFKEVREIFRQ